MEAICTNCKIPKPLGDFYTDKSKKLNVTSWCKLCTYEKRKGCPVLAEKRRNRLMYDAESVRRHRRKSYCDNKHIKAKYQRYRRANDPMYRLKENIRTRIRMALNKKSWSKSSNTHKLLGADYITVYKHIQSLFIEGMTWDSVGTLIHIDHIIPLASATSEEDLIKLFHYKNLQPLWAEDNLRKGDKVDKIWGNM